MSILELMFAETKQSIGHVEFDLGTYTNQMKDTMKKIILDLKSEKYPGSQIYLYINIQVLDPLPERPVEGRPSTIMGGGMRASTIIGDGGVKFDEKANQYDIQIQDLQKDIRELEDERGKVEQQNERLKFSLQ